MLEKNDISETLTKFQLNGTTKNSLLVKKTVTNKIIKDEIMIEIIAP